MSSRYADDNNDNSKKKSDHDIFKTNVILIVIVSILCLIISNTLQTSYSPREAFKGMFPATTGDNRRTTNITQQTLNITITAGATSPMAQMANSAYSPEDDKVKVNSIVTWKNEDNVVHTVTSVDPNDKFDSGNIDPDKTWTHTFNKKVSISYFCKLHPYMSGTITVE